MARCSGWCSHVIEEQFGEACGRPVLYRPKCEYVGSEGLKYGEREN